MGEGSAEAMKGRHLFFCLSWCCVVCSVSVRIEGRRREEGGRQRRKRRSRRSRRPRPTSEITRADGALGVFFVLDWHKQQPDLSPLTYTHLTGLRPHSVVASIGLCSRSRPLLRSSRRGRCIILFPRLHASPPTPPPLSPQPLHANEGSATHDPSLPCLPRPSLSGHGGLFLPALAQMLLSPR